MSALLFFVGDAHAPIPCERREDGKVLNLQIALTNHQLIKLKLLQKKETTVLALSKGQFNDN